MAGQPILEPLTLQDMTNAMTRSATGVSKTENHNGNLGMRPQVALLTQLNKILQEKK